MEQKKAQPARKLRENVADASHYFLWRTTRTKVNDNTKELELELAIAIVVKFWNIQSHIFSLYLIVIGFHQFWYFSSVLIIIMKTN